MGIAYRAQDLKLQRPVAVKLLPPELTADPERRKRFVPGPRAAAQVLAQLDSDKKPANSSSKMVKLQLDLPVVKTLYLSIYSIN